MSGLVPWARGQAYAPTFAQLVPYRQEVNPPSPTAPPSLREWWRELKGETPEVSGHVQSAVVGLRQNAEGAAIGALLAFVDTDLGGLDLGGRVPLDWAAAALFYALSIQDAGKADSLSSDFRAMGQSCTTIAMYRMIHKWRESSKNMPRNTIDTTGDPVLAAGKHAF
jgi:hypothetical protein